MMHLIDAFIKNGLPTGQSGHQPQVHSVSFGTLMNGN